MPLSYNKQKSYRKVASPCISKINFIKIALKLYLSSANFYDVMGDCQQLYSIFPCPFHANRTTNSL